MKEVVELKRGDKFVLPSYSVETPYVYVVVDVPDNKDSAECVCINSGKIFTFGRAVPVVPVEVKLQVKGAVKAKPPTDLTGKCGSCFYASAESKRLFPNTRSYVQCLHPDRKWHSEIEAYRPRTTKCCKKYKAKENIDA